MDWLTLTANILDRAKKLAPQKTPQPDPDTTCVWADWLSKHVQSEFPTDMWVDAVDHWAGHHNGEMLSPQAFMVSLRQVREHWETVPEKRAKLEAHRRARTRRRNLELFGSEDGRRALPPAKSDQEAVEATKKRYRTLQAREARKRAGDPSQQRFGA